MPPQPATRRDLETALIEKCWKDPEFKKTVLKLKLAANIRDIKMQKGLSLEALKGDRKGYYSVRVDYSYRLILTIDKNETISITEVIMIHDLTNHYQ